MCPRGIRRSSRAIRRIRSAPTRCACHSRSSSSGGSPEIGSTTSDSGRDQCVGDVRIPGKQWSVQVRPDAKSTDSAFTRQQHDAFRRVQAVVAVTKFDRSERSGARLQDGPACVVLEADHHRDGPRHRRHCPPCRPLAVTAGSRRARTWPTSRGSIPLASVATGNNPRHARSIASRGAVGPPQVLVTATDGEQRCSVTDLVDQERTESFEFARGCHLFAILAAADEDQVRRRNPSGPDGHVGDACLDASGFRPSRRAT